MEQRLWKAQLVFLELFVAYDRFSADRQIMSTLFDADLEKIDYKHVAGFTVFLVYAEEFAAQVAWFAAVLRDLEVETLALAHSPPTFIWEYVWIAAAAVCALVML